LVELNITEQNEASWGTYLRKVEGGHCNFTSTGTAIQGNKGRRKIQGFSFNYAFSEKTGHVLGTHGGNKAETCGIEGRHSGVPGADFLIKTAQKGKVPQLRKYRLLTTGGSNRRDRGKEQRAKRAGRSKQSETGLVFGDSIGRKNVV